MLNAGKNRSAHVFFLCCVCCLGLAACATNSEKSPGALDASPSAHRPVSDAPRIAELEWQLAERQRQCAEDKRRQDQALRESQMRNEQLQKKLDALLAIDRELRSRGKDR